MAADLDTFAGESGARVSNRRIGAFLRTLYAPDLAISEKGARRAQAFLDDEGVMGDDMSDALDFDRPRPERAAAALARALRDSGPLRVLPAGASAADAGAAPAVGGAVPGGEPTLAPLPGAARRANGRIASSSVGALASEPLASSADEARPLDLRAAPPAAVPPPEAAAAPAETKGRGRAWVMVTVLLVLAGVAGALALFARAP
jgi:hypothetical protein